MKHSILKKILSAFLVCGLFFLFSSNGLAVVTPLTDISDHPYEQAITYLYQKGIVQGYGDHSYQPGRSVNRAEFTKILVGATLGSEPQKPTGNCFPDVDKDQWYATWVCYAKGQNIIAGYKDGKFRPEEKINLAEASKILVNTLGVKLTATSKTGVWYEPFIRSLQDFSYIPDSFSSVSENVNRGQMAEMIYRIMEQLTDRPAKKFDVGQSLACLDDQAPPSVDMDAVREAWLNWHNDARTKRGIASLSLSTGLNYSSSLWAKANKASGAISHDRPNGQTPSDWFDEIGIKFKAMSGIQFGENLGERTYACSLSDCTQEAIKAAKWIFDAFMAEEGTSYTGHYDNIVEDDFVELGLGIAIDASKKRMYLTTQYSFGVESYPSNVCSQ